MMSAVAVGAGETFARRGSVHLGQTMCSKLPYRGMPADKQHPTLLEDHFWSHLLRVLGVRWRAYDNPPGSAAGAIDTNVRDMWVFPCRGRVHLGQTVCSHLPYRVAPADKQAPAMLGALLGTFAGAVCCMSPVWDGLPTTALLALQQEMGFTTVQHAGLNPITFR